MLYDENGSSVDAGHIVVSLPLDPVSFPLTPQGARYVWLSSYQTSHAKSLAFIGSGLPSVSRCMIANSTKLRPILSLSGARSANLSRAGADLAYCCTASAPVVQVASACTGQPSAVRPASLTLACDGTADLKHLTWSSWTATKAMGSGILRTDTCNCGGLRTFADYPVIVSLSMPEPADRGMAQEWSEIKLTFPDKSPYRKKTVTLNI